MEPKPEDREAYLKGQTVEPIKPIVFYIDNSTPYQWRSYIKKGIEDWQTAFEKAGFKNAIIAKEITDSMHVDMDDVNYSVLTYAASKTQWVLPYSTLVREKFWKQISCGGTMYFLWYVNGLLFRQELFVRKLAAYNYLIR